MIDILIADDHKIVRQGLRSCLEQDKEIRVVGEAADGEETVNLVKQLNPDIALVDITMPKLNGLLATQHIQNLAVKTKVIILSMYSDSGLVLRVVKNGIKGYVLKSSSFEELLLAIKTVYSGKVYFCHEVMEILVNTLNAGEAENRDLFSILTPREVEILHLISEGDTNAVIAAKMNIGFKTVEKHRTNIMSKLDIHSTAGLVRFAIKNGLLTDESFEL